MRAVKTGSQFPSVQKRGSGIHPIRTDSQLQLSATGAIPHSCSVSDPTGTLRVPGPPLVQWQAHFFPGYVCASDGAIPFIGGKNGAPSLH